MLGSSRFNFLNFEMKCGRIHEQVGRGMNLIDLLQYEIYVFLVWSDTRLLGPDGETISRRDALLLPARV